MKSRFIGQILRKEEKILNTFTHAMVPTPFEMPNGEVRLFFSALNSKGQGMPFYCDLNPLNPIEVIRYKKEPILQLGDPGTFDESGVIVTSIIRNQRDQLMMYYVGFKKVSVSRYEMLTGLAVSEDAGLTFRKHSTTPILKKIKEESYFRAGTYVMAEAGKFRMWYVGGSNWFSLDDKELPQNVMKYLESEDGIHWSNYPVTQLIPNPDSELGFGRPWVFRRGNFSYEMLYSIRSKQNGKYKMGFAHSRDNGRSWTRADAELDEELRNRDDNNMHFMYASVIDICGRIYCFYNGSDFGIDGIYLSELEF